MVGALAFPFPFVDLAGLGFAAAADEEEGALAVGRMDLDSNRSRRFSSASKRIRSSAICSEKPTKVSRRSIGVEERDWEGEPEWDIGMVVVGYDRVA